MIIVNQESARDSAGSGALDNFIAWRQEKTGKMIVAVGSPSQWKSSEPLPAGVVLTDLVQASSDDPNLASELWGAFLRYVSFRAAPGFWSQLRMQVLGIPVRVSIGNPSVRSAVTSAIAKCTTARLKLHAD